MMKTPYRPILHIPKTKMEKICDIVGIGLFILSNLFIIFQWSQIPDRIPGHFNAKGEVDRWDSKYELIILPFIGMFGLLLTSLFEKAPHMYNYPKRINESNAEKFYLNSRKMLNIIKNICMILFALINFQIVQIALGKTEFLWIWFIPGIIVSLIITIGIGIYKQSKIK